jgi:hypothetical protein
MTALRAAVGDFLSGGFYFALPEGATKAENNKYR